MARERSAEDRERARLERAARRAEREGRPPPTELPSMEVPPPSPGAVPVEPEPPIAPEPPVAPDPEPPAEPEPLAVEPPAEFEADEFISEPSRPLPETADLPAVEPEPELFYDPLIEGEATPAQPHHEPERIVPVEPVREVTEAEDIEPEPELEEPEPVELELDEPEDPEPEDPELDEPDDPEPDTLPEHRPLPAYPPVAEVVPDAVAERRQRRVREILDRHQQASPAAPAAPHRRSRARYVVLAVLAVIVIAIGWFANALFQPFKGDGSGRTVVQIPTGASVGQIGDLLKRRGVISSAFFFEARATLAGRRDDFKAGRFTLAQGMSNAAAMDAISKGPPPDVTRIVIPEGQARTQVRDTIGKRLRGDYLALTRTSNVLDPRRYGAPRSVSSLEGFLFPDTYELKKGATTGTLVRDQLTQFKREFATVNLAASKRRKLTAYDVLIIASMIDQEAQVPRERRLVASVIVNRLREGIPLGIDATIRYATNNRTRPLTESQINSSSPYNTRERRGLPPGPIGSPGLAAIRAAADPASTKYLYYVVKPCGNGEHAFSTSYDEFLRNSARYERERKRLGRSPAKC